jgi:hypothetical protein
MLFRAQGRFSKVDKAAYPKGGVVRQGCGHHYADSDFGIKADHEIVAI